MFCFVLSLWLIREVNKIYLVAFFFAHSLTATELSAVGLHTQQSATHQTTGSKKQEQSAPATAAQEEKSKRANSSQPPRASNQQRRQVVAHGGGKNNWREGGGEDATNMQLDGFCPVPFCPSSRDCSSPVNYSAYGVMIRKHPSGRTAGLPKDDDCLAPSHESKSYSESYL